MPQRAHFFWSLLQSQRMPMLRTVPVKAKMTRVQYPAPLYREHPRHLVSGPVYAPITMTNLKNLLCYKWCHIQSYTQYCHHKALFLNRLQLHIVVVYYHPKFLYSFPININRSFYYRDEERGGLSWGGIICYISDQFAILDSFLYLLRLWENGKAIFLAPTFVSSIVRTTILYSMFLFHAIYTITPNKSWYRHPK